jgi:hypothetical protein
VAPCCCNMSYLVQISIENKKKEEKKNTPMAQDTSRSGAPNCLSSIVTSDLIKSNLFFGENIITE